MALDVVSFYEAMRAYLQTPDQFTTFAPSDVGGGYGATGRQLWVATVDSLGVSYRMIFDCEYALATYEMGGGSQVKQAAPQDPVWKSELNTCIAQFSAYAEQYTT